MIRDQLSQAVADALRTIGVTPPEVIPMERPARREHGDWSSTVSLSVAKVAGRKPRDLGEELAAALRASPPAHVRQIDVAGPGFVNFHLAETWLTDVLRVVVAEGPDSYAAVDLGRGSTTNVEFVSANPTGPLHAGHGRNAAYGDAVARLLSRSGYAVTREFYLNDRGTQMGHFAASLEARRDGRLIPEGGYAGQYIIDWAAEMPEGVDALEWGRDRAIASHIASLERLGVHFDVWFSEREMVATGAIEETLALLEARDMVYEADGALWLRSTTFGDDKDRVLRKSDGEYTYLCPDIAYHRSKFDRGFAWLIDVWGADHHGYVPRLRAALQTLGHDPAEITFCITQLVQLVRDGQEVRLSKRTGEIVELDEVLDEAGADATRFTYLLQSVDSRQVFDIALVTRKAMDNPVYYVQYAHARICSLTRQAATQGVTRSPLAEVDLGPLVHPRELAVLRLLEELPDVVAIATRELAPHRITAWVRELAGAFHGFYTDCRIMGDDVSAETTQARLWLVEASRIGLVIGLGLLGVSAPEAM